MKKITLVVFLLASVIAYGQKPVKPNLNKALKSLQDGKLDEAKEMIDLATTYEKTKDDGKTWYYKGLIYSALDTTSNATYKALAQEPLTIAMASFSKADSLEKGGKEYFILPPNSVLPITKKMQLKTLANYYLNKGALVYQDDKFEEALVSFEKTAFIEPKDTMGYFYAGYAAHSLENYDKAIYNFQKHIENGGTSPNAFLIMYQIYAGPKQNKEKALEIIKQGKAKLPNNKEIAKAELGLLIDLDRIDEAKTGLEKACVQDPTNKIYFFYLGYVNARLEDAVAAKKNFDEALKLDPNYFDAQFQLAQLYFADAFKSMKEMNALGISAADKKKKLELDKIVVDKYRIAMPYMEKAEKLDPSNTDVLEKLSNIYYNLGEDAKLDRITKRLKELGVSE